MFHKTQICGKLKERENEMKIIFIIILLVITFSAKAEELIKLYIHSICLVESNHNPNVINHFDGGSKSLGYCQIKLNTAKMLGFKGTERDLMDLETNLYWATEYLKYQLNRYEGDVRKAVLSYNSGSYLPSKKNIGKAINEKYWLKVSKNIDYFKCNLISQN